ncbi:MAG: LysR family transcriptional regulator [Pseudomonadota bacterium]
MHLDNFDLNLLVGIEALMRRKSVTAAAKELHITQSAMSSALKRARRHFADEILYYDGQHMVPTPFGRDLQLLVPEMIASLRALSRMRAEGAIERVERQFTIIASDYVAAVYIAALSRQLARVAPQVSLAVLPFTQESLRRFHAGRIDFLIAPKSATIEGEADLLFEDGFRCVLWRDNPVLSAGLTAEAYLSASHILTSFFLEEGKSHFERWLADIGPSVRIVAALPSFVMLPHYVSGTNRVATIHHRLEPHFAAHNDLVFVDTPLPVPPLQEYLVTNPIQRHDTEAMLLRGIMHEVAAKLPPHPAG